MLQLVKRGKTMCIFCKIVNKEIPSYQLYEDDYVIAILDISQVTKGHTLIISKKHYENIMEADPETLHHIIETAQKVGIQLKEKLGANGFNVLNNNGSAAGQTVNHLHFHIIPRYNENDAIVCEFKESGIKVDEVAKQLGI